MNRDEIMFALELMKIFEKPNKFLWWTWRHRPATDKVLEDMCKRWNKWFGTSYSLTVADLDKAKKLSMLL